MLKLGDIKTISPSSILILNNINSRDIEIQFKIENMTVNEMQ